MKFDERWEEDRRGKYETLDDGKSKKKLCKNIFESKLIKVSYRLPMNKNRFRTKVFPPLFVSFNLKFKSMDDGTLDDRKLSENMFEFDEGWGEKTLDDEKLCKNIFESK